MQIFLIGLTGSMVGGVILALTFTAIYFYEKRAAKKATEQFMNDLKASYEEKLNSLGIQAHGKDSYNKYN